MSAPAPVTSSSSIPWPLLAVPIGLIAMLALASSHTGRSVAALAVAMVAAVMLAVMLHIGIMALVGVSLFKWRAHTIAFGTGPSWLRTSIADIEVTFGVVFFAGGVGLDNSSQIRGWRGALGELSGGFVLLLAAAALMRDPGAAAAVPDVWQAIVVGALSPLSEAQALLATSVARLAAGDGPALLGLVCLVLGAFNLMPIPVLNGGNAILSVLMDRDGPLAGTVFKCGLMLLLVLLASWMLALMTFAWRALS